MATDGETIFCKLNSGHNFCARVNTEMKVNEFMRTYRQCFFLRFPTESSKKDEIYGLGFLIAGQ